MQGNRTPRQQVKLCPKNDAPACATEGHEGLRSALAQPLFQRTLKGVSVPEVPPLPDGHSPAPRWMTTRASRACGLVARPVGLVGEVVR